MAAMNKRELRKYLRSLYPGEAARNAESTLLCGHILRSERYRQARVIGGYMALPREADITPVLQDALLQGKTLALPLCGDAPYMTLRRVASLEELVPGAYGILEPKPDAQIVAPEQLDLLLVPLEGIDREGFRLGKGGGYYDHLLSSKRVPTLGCALSWQQVPAVPREAWDVPLHACADRDGIHDYEHFMDKERTRL